MTHSMVRYKTPPKKIVWLEAKSIYPKMYNVALCDLSQAKVKDNLNNWAGRDTVGRESTKEKTDLLFCRARELVVEEKVIVIQKKTRSLS